MHKVLILGPQGCGKGTQAVILAEKLGVPELSMGALLRSAAAEDGDFALRIADIQKRGELVSDVDALTVLKKRLAQPDAANGYVLDGYPRNEEQYLAYISFDVPTHVIVISVPHDVSMARLLKRAELEKRVDDTPEVIERRLQIYHDDTQPMITHFAERGIVHEVDGTGGIAEVAGRIGKIF
ncbi:MAG: nucleoside monophosphate kinase [Patescibacteria group bacterium]